MASLKDDIQYTTLALLRADSGVASIVGARIYEEPPDNPASPFVVAGDMREAREITMGSSTTSGTNISTVYLPIIIEYMPNPAASVAKSYYQAARDAAAAIEAALHKATLTLSTSGWASVMCVKESEAERRGDGGLRMIEQTYKIIAFKTDKVPEPAPGPEPTP